MLSVVIPSYKDPLLHRTIDSIISNFTKEFEIIVVLDGYWTTFVDDPRIRVVHLGKNRGMREAINAGVKVARGEYIMRTDEHCMFAEGFDEVMTSQIKDNWIMTATRYFLDPKKWEVMDLRPVVHEKLKPQEVGKGILKWSGNRWPSRDKQKANKPISESMAMQGSCWVMPKKWWETVVKRLDTENYGTMYQDSHEMVFKTWQAGGKLMVNKNTWFAHKHVSFPRSHQYSRSQWEKGVDYAYKHWKDYYEKEIKPKWHL